MRVRTRSNEETRALGEALGRLLEPGDVVTLSGELGAGKTVFAQGVASGLGVDEPVSSPTFALVHEYRGRVPVWHLDLYRLRGPEELPDVSWEELLGGGGVVLVEWPERAGVALPAERLDVAIRDAGADLREIELRPHGARMRAVLAALAQRWTAGEGAFAACGEEAHWAAPGERADERG